jgi:chondroitin-sulfate-ABC endolyase/exolyase
MAKDATLKEDIIISKLGFETPKDMHNWSVTKGSLNLSDKHQKQGKQSLLWNWKKGDELKIDNQNGLQKAAGFYSGGQPERFEPAFFQNGRYGGLKMWIYQTEACNGQMTFQVGHNTTMARTNPKYRFTINLNFTGWRAVWVQFNEDAPVRDYNGPDEMHSMLALAPEGIDQGQLYIDHFQLLEFISYKRHSDLIFQNNKSNVRSDSYEILAPYQKYLSMEGESDLRPSILNSFKTIENRLEFLILGGSNANWKEHGTNIPSDLEKQLSKAQSTYEQLQIKTENGRINGIPLFSSRDEQGTSNGKTFQAVMETTLFPLAMDYRRHHTPESQDKILQLLRYFNDQGWAAGSAIGTVDHIIRVNGYATALFLMRHHLTPEELQQHQECLAWHTRIGNIIDCDKSKGENTDMVRGGALAKLISILLLPDSPRKTTLFNEFTEYMNYVAAFAPGYSDTIKPDYSIFHHRGTYLNAYGVSAINTMAMIYWLLNNTDFSPSFNTQQTIKNTLQRQYDIAFGLELHPGVCGRFPYKNTAIDRFMLPAFAFMSLNENSVEDVQMAARFNYLYKLSPRDNIKTILFPALTYSGTFGTLGLMAGLHQHMENTSLAPQDGHYSLPYSSFSVHRRSQWMASVKGYDKYVWDYETGHKGENNLGRYLSHGSLFLLKGKMKNSFANAGMDLNAGFHWGYLPGATTKALPIDKVFYENTPTTKYKEGYHRSFTETTFARGLSARGMDGIFAMALRDDVHPDPDKILFDNSFRAHKSWFFFGDEMVCLGSNIQNNDERYATITTLFQSNIGENGASKKETLLNGESIGSSLNLHQQLNGVWLTDVQGIHYIIPESQEVILEQNKQESLQKTNSGKYTPIQSPHVKAWLNHGKKPANKGYEYLVLMDANIEEAQQRKETRGYSVLQQDAIAHIVHHEASQQTGYAIFNAGEFKPVGAFIRTDTPIMAMWQEDGQNSTLSMANPDLKLAQWNHNMSVMPGEIVHAWSEGSIVTIHLEGLWKLAASVNNVVSVKAAENQTELQIFCKDGLSIDIPLRKLTD